MRGCKPPLVHFSPVQPEALLLRVSSGFLSYLNLCVRQRFFLYNVGPLPQSLSCLSDRCDQARHCLKAGSVDCSLLRTYSPGHTVCADLTLNKGANIVNHES